MTAKIYKPCKSAMQSGAALSNEWRLEFIPKSPNFIEPIMGWTGSKETLSSQVILHFYTKEEAIKYAIRYDISFVVEEPKRALPKKLRTYVQNFAYTTHTDE